MAQSGRPLKVKPEHEFILEEIDNENNDFVISSLLKNGIDILDSYGRNALINAVISNNPIIFEWTIENGSNINLQDKNGYSALHFAAQENNLEMTQRLVNKGADVNITDKHGNAPIWTAIMNYNGGENLSLIKYLQNNGANIELKNNYGRSPRDISTNLFH